MRRANLRLLEKDVVDLKSDPGRYFLVVNAEDLNQIQVRPLEGGEVEAHPQAELHLVLCEEEYPVAGETPTVQQVNEVWHKAAVELPLYDLQRDPTTPRATLKLDGPRAQTPRFDRPFGEFAEYYLADELYKLSQHRDFSVIVEDLADYTQYSFERLTDQDFNAIKAKLDQVVKDFEANKLRLNEFDISDLSTDCGMLRGPDVTSPEGQSTLWYEIPELASGSIASILIANPDSRSWADSRLREILSVKGLKTVKGPIIRQVSGVRALTWILHLNKPAVQAERLRVYNELCYFESELRRRVRKLQVANTVTLDSSRLFRASYRMKISRILPPEDYIWHTYESTTPMTLTTRSGKHSIEMKQGTPFGIRPSSSGKEVRLITEKFGPTIVFTITPEERRQLVMNSNAFEKGAALLPIVSKEDSRAAMAVKRAYEAVHSQMVSLDDLATTPVVIEAQRVLAETSARLNQVLTDKLQHALPLNPRSV